MKYRFVLKDVTPYVLLKKKEKKKKNTVELTCTYIHSSIFNDTENGDYASLLFYYYYIYYVKNNVLMIYRRYPYEFQQFCPRTFGSYA